MAQPVTKAAEVFLRATHGSMRRHFIWYPVRGLILITAGVLSILSPVMFWVALVTLCGSLQMMSVILGA